MSEYSVSRSQITETRRALLLSSSYVYGSDYLQFCQAELSAFLKGRQAVCFVPYALRDADRYAKMATRFLATIGVRLTSLHRSSNPVRSLENADGVFVGGGNTFRLLSELQALEVMPVLRRRVLSGETVFCGASAGAILACPTIGTTNDMPICETANLRALGLIGFQINPHYLMDTPTNHMGESRDERIREYLEESELAVVGLREGGIINVDGESVTLLAGSARVFRRGHEEEELRAGAPLDHLEA